MSVRNTAINGLWSKKPAGFVPFRSLLDLFRVSSICKVLADVKLVEKRT